jgi:hypothetical protein
VPVVSTIDVVTTHTTVLFGTSCTTISGGNNGNGNNNGGGNNNNTDNGNGNGNGNTGQDTGSASVTTPPPSVITSESSTTLPNGDVSVVTRTSISTVPPSTHYVGPTPGTQSDNTPSSNNTANLGAIIGGSVGGFFGLIAIAVGIWFINKRRRRWDDIFEKDLNNDPFLGGGGSTNLTHGSSAHSGKSRGRFSLGPDLDSGPKPYQYGLVGQGANPQGDAPPSNTNPMMSRPSTASSTLPLVSAAAAGGRVTPSSSSHPTTPMYYHSQFTPTPSTAPTVPSPWLPGPGLGITPSSSAHGHGAVDEGYFAPRAGSPVSLSEQAQGRRLQVTNGPPPSIYGGQSIHQRMTSDTSSIRSPGFTPGGLSVTNPDSNSQVNLVPLAATMGKVAAASGADASRGLGGVREVKGRKSSLGPNEGAGPSDVLVHTDAGTVPQSSRQAERQDTEPPAYSL